MCGGQLVLQGTGFCPSTLARGTLAFVGRFALRELEHIFCGFLSFATFIFSLGSNLASGFRFGFLFRRGLFCHRARQFLAIGIPIGRVRFYFFCRSALLGRIQITLVRRVQNLASLDAVHIIAVERGFIALIQGNDNLI